MENQYEVLSPWAEADPVALMGLSPRLSDLSHKKVGLFVLSYKHASARVQSVVERRLKERFPDLEFSRFERNQGADFDEAGVQDGAATKDLAAFEDWVKGVDAVVGAVGD